MKIAAVSTALPKNYYDQEALLAAFREEWATRYFNVRRLEDLHKNVLVGGRHLALPIEEYPKLATWGQANDHWIRVAQELGGEAVLGALDRAGLAADDVDAFYFVTVTGVATPSIDARLVNLIGLPARVKRVPIFGLGCLAGAAGVARAADYLKGHPSEVAMLLSVELCSLTLQREDLSVPNLIASGLFGDGAAAVVLVGDDRECSGPRVVDSRSAFYPGTEEVMGWEVSERGFKVLLSAEVPEMVRRHLRRDVDAFLAEHGLERGDISTWISHPGGPKVLEAMEEALELQREAFEGAWRTLREVGNMSSTSVLMVLEENLGVATAAGELGSDVGDGSGFLFGAGPAAMGGGVSQVFLGVDSRVAFTVLIAVIALQRLWELGVSNRHLRALRTRGGYEVGAAHYPWMVALHSAFLISCVTEVWLLHRPLRPEIAAVALVVLVVALVLRWWVLSTLGDRWTTRVIVLPDEQLITEGPYRWLRHPNYFAVVLEIVAIPMLHSAWLTAVVFSIANLLVLRARIGIEDRALGRGAGDVGAAEGGTL